MHPILECKKVTYSYPLQQSPSLQNINLTLEQGKIYGILGANGSGKTTLCSLLRGFIPKFYQGTITGEVLLKGRPLAEYAGQLVKEIGYVFQNPFTQLSGVKDTVFEEVAYGLENMGVPADAIETAVIAAMENTNIRDLALKHPRQLSGGQLQRTALASVLVQNPDILILDEPTSQLDPQETSNVFHIIKKLKEQNKTIIIAEHKTDWIAEYADEVLLLDKGRVYDKGNKTRILSNPALEEIGIMPPQVTLLCQKLRESGMPITTLPTTYAQTKTILEKLLFPIVEKR